VRIAAVPVVKFFVSSLNFQYDGNIRVNYAIRGVRKRNVIVRV